MIDSQTQTQAILAVGEWVGGILGETARKAFVTHADGPHQPTAALTLEYTGDYGWSYPDFFTPQIAAAMADLGLDIAPADGAIDAVMITESTENSDCRCKNCGRTSTEHAHLSCYGAY